MPSVALGYGHYFFWHLPTLVLSIATIIAIVAVLRQLARGAYGPSARALRWSIVGWCALVLAFASAVTVPYLRAAAYWSVDRDGAWVLRNYLYVRVARIDADELREIRARDLGGAGLGVGHVEIRREDGSVVRTVRLDRTRLRSALDSLGYARADLSQDYGDSVVRAHRFRDRSPWLAPVAH